MSEANASIIIDRLPRESDWVLSGDDGVVNVDTEMQNQQVLQTMFSRTVLTFHYASSKQRKNWSLPYLVKSKHEDMRKGCSERQTNKCISFHWNNHKI